MSPCLVFHLKNKPYNHPRLTSTAFPRVDGPDKPGRYSLRLYIVFCPCLHAESLEYAAQSLVVGGRERSFYTAMRTVRDILGTVSAKRTATSDNSTVLGYT